MINKLARRHFGVFYEMSNFESLYQSSVLAGEELFKKYFKPAPGFETIVTHTGHRPTDLPDMGNPIIPPITPSTTFEQLAPATGKYDYSRSGNYSRHVLENCLAAIEGTDQALTFASGLAALGAVIQILSSGDHVVAFDDLYGGTGRFFRKISSKHGLIFDFVDMRDVKLFEAALTPRTKMVFLETPSNPLMRLVDIAEISKRAHNFDKNITVVVDNTFITPYYQRPLELGADVSLNSLTKYINGHSDVVMGSVAVKKGLPDLVSEFRFIQFAAGAIPSVFDCYLCLRGVRTLSIRMQAHMRSALILAILLENHPKVEAVLHPGLRSHPQHELAVKQMCGFSGMIAIYLKCSAQKAEQFVKDTKIFALAESLGGYESLIEIPSLMTHASVPPEMRAKLNIADNMLRLSVGIEDCRDLAWDLYQALENL
uniref:cystathionine gamma-lyase n=1 Tax=Schistocephalus solidus TaxID=70667 RepID=A0A0X3P6S8_SCHSO